MPELDSTVFYGHLPDGTILGPVPFDDTEKMIELVRQRMTPEAITAMIERLAADEGRVRL
ncbi:hypothetical protein PV755_09350 [Streptomyces caniscabiei]|uniref:Uncharacterized protein n=1 Tax=Streptomyces caniscabiei TaxID=2746961 RepID=A0A927KX25_9ACTN|nr:hypothetical protein [Streptomyces caniscabiei]MBD9721936.1 hypothetical protein [Streptomyces caniscabiei]MDX3509127.1 hypothetical protein [Streptomyces caniscabiei]MDX3717120.1 hypothetical protein [Streptomyces caniscabiei]WEO22987.1 hypothetical protein IHE65_07375 [Streptomyces caniscabiei]